MSNPYFQNFRPSKNYLGIVPHSDIYFEILDPDGIDIYSLTIYINGILGLENKVFQTGFSGALTKENPQETEYHVNINPDVNFLFGQTVTVGISVEDKLGNKVNEFYTFNIIDNLDGIPPTTIPVPRGGYFNTAISVTLNVYDDSSTMTYYTVDGSDPKIAGVLYTGAINIADEGTTILKFYSRDDDNADPNDDNIEATKQETYILDFTPPITSVNKIGGNYVNPQNIALTTNEPATIYYTLDGSAPTTASTEYTQPFIVGNEGTTVLNYFAVDLAGNVEAVQSQTYIISFAKSNLAPTNAMVISPYVRGILDIVWDDMGQFNNTIAGYNIYRSQFYESGYVKLNESLVTTTTYRDQATDIDIIEEDVSQQFRQTIAINRTASDTFLGNTIDKTKWLEYDPAQIIQQCNGIVCQDVFGNSAPAHIKSTFKLQGDFDIEVGLDLYQWDAPTAKITEAGLSVERANGDRITISKRRSLTNNIIESNRVINGTPDLPISTVNLQTLTTFRITRVGNVVTTTYTDSTGSLILHNTFNDAFEDDLYVKIYVQASDVKFECRFHDFKVNDGVAIIVKPYNPQKEIMIKTGHRPIVDSVVGGTGNTKFVDLFQDAHTNQIEYVQVWIDGIKANIKEVAGLEGEVILDTSRYYDYINKTYIDPVVPNENSIVKIAYRTTDHSVDYSLRKNLYYKVTLVHDCGETDLRYAKPITLQGDGLDYAYAEGLRRNKWILDQAGERVLLFVKSRAGERCECYLSTERTHRQPKNKCTICYGTGFIPPYAGPFCITVSPAMAEQKLTQTERGLRLDYVTEVFTITPHIINQRDFLVRRDGTILGVGAQTVPEVRGRRLEQQHFSIQPVDRTDVRYDYLDSLNVLDNRKQYPCVNKSHVITDTKDNDGVCNTTQQKGRTLTFENINF